MHSCTRIIDIILCDSLCYMQGDLVLDMSEHVIEFVLKLAVNANKLSDVEVDPSNTSVHNQCHLLFILFMHCSRAVWQMDMYNVQCIYMYMYTHAPADGGRDV